MVNLPMMTADRSIMLFSESQHHMDRSNPAIPSQSATREEVSAFAESSIEKLRRHRCRPERNLEIGGMVDQFRREAGRARRGAGTFLDAWEAVVPPEIAAATRVRGIRGGVGRVGVLDAATSYDLDQRLRNGLLAELRLAFQSPLRRVKLEIDGSLTRD